MPYAASSAYTPAPSRPRPAPVRLAGPQYSVVTHTTRPPNKRSRNGRRSPERNGSGACSSPHFSLRGCVLRAGRVLRGRVVARGGKWVEAGSDKDLTRRHAGHFAHQARRVTSGRSHPCRVTLGRGAPLTAGSSETPDIDGTTPGGAANAGYAGLSSGGSRHAVRRSYTRANSSCHGYASDNAIHTLRTLIRITAPIFNSFSRIVSACAASSGVSFRPNSRNARSIMYATVENARRSWLARSVWQLVRSANRPSCCSLMRFSMSPRAQYSCSYNVRASHSSADSDVTTNRGFEPLSRCSALPITRRSRDQLFCVRYVKSWNTRAAWPVRSCSSFAS